MAVNTTYIKAGLHSVGAYQRSGIPFASSSITIPENTKTSVEVEFPYITKFVTVVNTNVGSNVSLRVGFSANGAQDQESKKYYFTLNNGESYTGDWAVKSVFLLSDAATGTTASVIAGLAGIDKTCLPGGWSGSNGIG